MSSGTTRPVAVTGLGIITSIGDSLPAFEKALFEGTSGVGPVSLFDPTGFLCTLAAEVRGRPLRSHFGPREARRVSRCDLLGLIAAKEAVADTRLDQAPYDRARIGVVLGGGAGGMLSWEKHRRAVWLGKSKPRPSLVLASSPCTLTDLIAVRYGMTGLRSTITTACSSSATAIGYAMDLILTGMQDMVITGGSEALSELTFAGFNSLKAMDPQPCRPFDKNRRGLSLGEGAAILVLEDCDRAKARGATIHAQVLGYAVNADAYHMTSPDPEGTGMQKVMAKTIAAAGLRPEDVHYINAHGTGTKANDSTETKGIKKVFGERGAGRIPVSSTKSMVGHCLGAAGAVEAVATILALRRQMAPPTLRLETPDPECDLDYVPDRARKQPMQNALSNSFAFGGNNTALLFGRYEG